MISDSARREAHDRIERLCQRAQLMPVRPLVVDSDVLLHNLMWDSNPVKPPSKLLIQGGLGSIRPYVANHQLDEVRRHIPEVAARTRVDHARALDVFEQRYLPILWTADASLIDQADLALEVGTRDQDDYPIAQLAVLLGVRVVTKNRRHFGALAVEDYWLAVVSAYASVGLMDGANASLSLSVRASGEGAVAAGRAIKGGFEFLADHPRLAAGAGIVVLVLIIAGAWYLSDDERRLRAWDVVKRAAPVARFAGRALEGYLELAGIAVEADAVILASKLPRERLTLDQRIAEFLGGQRFPVPLEAMIEGISSDAGALVITTLRTNPAFVEHDGRWTLGRRCAARLE